MIVLSLGCRCVPRVLNANANAISAQRLTHCCLCNLSQTTCRFIIVCTRNSFRVKRYVALSTYAVCSCVLCHPARGTSFADPTLVGFNNVHTLLLRHRCDLETQMYMCAYSRLNPVAVQSESITQPNTRRSLNSLVQAHDQLPYGSWVATSLFAFACAVACTE